MTARILTLSLPDPARHPRAEALIAVTVEDLVDYAWRTLPAPARHPRALLEDAMTGEPTARGAALDEYSVAVGKGDAIDHTIITARLRTDYARAVARAVATDGIGDPPVRHIRHKLAGTCR